MTNTWPDIISHAMPQFERINRETGQLVTWQKESEFAAQAIMKNSMLAKCDKESVLAAIVNVAAVGLTLNPADGYAYLVPEYNKERKRTECQLRISFKGLIKSATDTGIISWVKAEIVKETDTFDYRGPCEMPIHQMNPFQDRGKTVGVYCIAKLASGDILCDVMDITQINLIKECAKTQNVWTKWPDEMAKKAIIKRASKQWPKSSASAPLHNTIKVINDVEGSEFDADASFDELQKTAAYIIDAYNENDLMKAGEAWHECSRKEQELLWVAKTKGGFFTQAEKDFVREAATTYRKANLEPIEGEAEEVMA